RKYLAAAAQDARKATCPGRPHDRRAVPSGLHCRSIAPETITPGVDTAMVLRWATTGGPRPAALALIGITAGCLIWGAAISLGMGALLAASALGFTLVKFAGAAYLVWLGLHLFLHPRESFAPSLTGTKGRGSLPAFRQGFLSNVLNP